jgi:PPOX class probable F420-dependent enzyme
MPTSRPALTAAIRDFLAGPRFMTVGTVDEDGTPRQAVSWYRLEPDDRVLLNSRPPRRWCADLLREPRVSLAVIDERDGYRWVGLSGVVDEVIHEVDRARADIVALAHRYHPEGPSAASIAAFRRQPRITFLVRVTAVHDHLEGD